MRYNMYFTEVRNNPASPHRGRNIEEEQGHNIVAVPQLYCALEEETSLLSLNKQIVLLIEWNLFSEYNQ